MYTFPVVMSLCDCMCPSACFHLAKIDQAGGPENFLTLFGLYNNNVARAAGILLV